MIIGQFSEAFPPITDGVGQVVKNYAYWLSKNNDTCYVITTKVPDTHDDYIYDILRYKSYKVLFKNNYRTGIPKLDVSFYNNLKSIKFDIIHSHSPFSAGKLGLDIAKQQDIPSVMTFHSKFKYDFKQIVKSDFISELMLKKIMPYFNKADDVWTVSESAVETLREYGYKGDVFIAENACDFTSETKSIKSIEMICNEYNFTKVVPIFAFVGQIINQKNVKMIVNALKIIDKNGYDFRMLFVGKGDKKNELERIVKSYNLDTKVIFTGNIYNRTMLKNIYQASSAILFPSLYDVSSLVIKEAASMRCPMILVENSTTSQGIKDLYNGFLIENNENSLAAKIEMIINNPDVAKNAGENAFKTLYRSWEDSVNKARQRYQYLIDNKKKQR